MYLRNIGTDNTYRVSSKEHLKNILQGIIPSDIDSYFYCISNIIHVYYPYAKWLARARAGAGCGDECRNTTTVEDLPFLNLIAYFWIL